MVFALQVTRSGTLAAGAPSVPGSTQTASLRYLHHDHLGSVAAITDGTTGTVIERLAFDPWGKRRNTNGQADTTDSLVGLTTDRGYTEHEHLDEMGIIHMNGRVYDPLVGRMMSADPFVQAPTNLKTFNRYAYVWNNPLKLYDPYGFNAQDTTTGSFVGTTTPSSPPSSSSPRATSPANCTGSCNAAPKPTEQPESEPQKPPSEPTKSNAMPEDQGNKGIRVTVAKGFGGTAAVGQDGTVNATVGVGYGVGVKQDSNVKTFGSGESDGTIGFGGVLNVTIGPFGCQASCNAGLEVKVDPDTKALTVKGYGVGSQNDTCTAGCSLSGKFGKGFNIGGNAGVTGSLSGSFRNR